MELRRHVFDSRGNPLSVLTLDPFAFILNTIAMGDVIAAAPVVKYMIDNYYTDESTYIVVAKKQFWPFFLPFVPQHRLRDFDDKSEEFWGIPKGWAVGLLNKPNDSRIVRNTPKAMHLSDYASLVFADRIIDRKYLNYVPIERVDVSHYGINFHRSVILVSTYRDVTRQWPAHEMLALAKWINDQGLTPVFIGKTDMDQHLEKKHLIPKSSLPEDVSKYGEDLRNETSIVELASIMDNAIAVCGVDSGPIHLAGTTKTTIVCGYTTVAPEHRVPTRQEGNTVALVPNLECAGCESRWRTNLWNFEHCYYKHANCCNMMTAQRFIKVLDKLL